MRRRIKGLRSSYASVTRRLKNTLTYGNVTATIAVFLAMSGAAVAVTTAPTNSVTSASIRDGAVRTADVGGGAVTPPKIAANAVRGGRVLDGSLSGADIRDESLSGRDFGGDSLSGAEIANDSLEGVDLKDGTVDSQDLAPAAIHTSNIDNQAITSAKIGDGQIRSDDLGPITIRSNAVAVDANSSGSLSAQCAVNETVLNGGGVFDGAANPARYVHASFPSGNSWVVFGRNDSNAGTTLRAHVTCLAG